VSNVIVEDASILWANGIMKPVLCVVPDFESNESNDANATVALVQRVSKRVAIGIPLELAVAGEGLIRTVYEELLRKHPELAIIQDVAKREFLEVCIRTLLQAKNPSANIRWLLERLYPDDFGKLRG
jgi:hypothetical protein